jgi:hypothetical protein
MGPYPELRTFHVIENDKERALKDGRVSAIISTEDIGRDGAIVRTAGWDFRSFMRNPVVLYAHSDSPGSGVFGGGGPTAGLPIARSQRPVVSGKQVTASADFDMEDEFAVRLFGKIQRGFVNATSVRWLPLKVTRETKKIEGEDREVVVFEKQELLEWSFVSVPADPKALISRADGGAFCADDFCDQEVRLDMSLTDEELQRTAGNGADSARKDSWPQALVNDLRYAIESDGRLNDADCEALRGLYRDLPQWIGESLVEDARPADMQRVIQAYTAVVATVAELTQRFAQPLDVMNVVVEAIARKTGRAPERIRAELE